MLQYISETRQGFNHAGSKARDDIEFILGKRYTVAFNAAHSTFYSGYDKLKYIFSKANINLIRDLLVCKNKTFVIQYPLPINKVYKQLFLNKTLKNNNVILFIHDLDCLRQWEGLSATEEVSLLSDCFALIVHNNYMKNKIIDMTGIDGEKIYVLSLFDYLLNNVMFKSRKLDFDVVFAGNLEKSKFLQQLDQLDGRVSYQLYGPNITDKINRLKCVNYMGVYKPDEIPFHLNGSFGLVWDGDSINTCSGKYGKYLSYNNPHKLSLYIASGLPVIAWKKAAIKDFIEENKIGFCVNSLNEISKIICGLTNEKYNEYLVNIKRIQTKVSSGFYTNRILDKIEKMKL